MMQVAREINDHRNHMLASRVVCVIVRVKSIEVFLAAAAGV